MFGKQHRFGPETTVPVVIEESHTSIRPSKKHMCLGTSQETAQRLIQWGEQVKHKHKVQAQALRDAREKAEDIECRSAPVQKVSLTRARRLFDEAGTLQSTSRHQHDRELVAAFMAESKELAECTFHPTLVAKKNSVVVHSFDRQDVFTRLYALRRKPDTCGTQEIKKSDARTREQWQEFLERQEQYQQHREGLLSELERVYDYAYRPTLSRRTRELAKQFYQKARSCRVEKEEKAEKQEKVFSHDRRKNPSRRPVAPPLEVMVDAERPVSTPAPISITIAQAEAFYQKEEFHRKNKQDRQLRLMLEKMILERAEVIHQSSGFRVKENPFPVSPQARKKKASFESNVRCWNSSTLVVVPKPHTKEEPPAPVRIISKEASDVWWKCQEAHVARRAEELESQRKLLWTASCPFQPKISHRSKLLAEMTAPSS